MMRSNSVRDGASLRKKMFVAVAVAALGIVATHLLFQVTASKKNAEVIAAWDGDLGSWDDVMQRYPSRAANGAAKELEQIAATLGVAMATRGVIDAPGPDGGPSAPDDDYATRTKMRVMPGDEAKAAFDTMKKPVFEWVDRELRRVGGEIEPMPAEGNAYFEENAPIFSAFRRELLLGEAPEWEMQLEKLFAAPIPNLLGQITMQRLLAAEALRHERGGRHGLALETVEAAWRLNGALRDSPILISQLIAAANARYVAATLRRFDHVPADWVSRLAEHDVREGMIVALKFEGWIWPHASERHLLSAHGTDEWTSRLVGRIAAPVMRLGLAEMSANWQAEVGSLPPDAESCGEGASAFDVEISWWNYIGKIAVPNLSNALDRADRAAVDLELTRKWIALDAARRRNAGEWPEDLPFPETLDACPEERLVYEVSGDGAATLAVAREIDWGKTNGLALPLRVAGSTTM